MLNVVFGGRDKPGLRILCLGAHSDDIEIGCGGTLLRLIAENAPVEVRWAVLGAAGVRRDEAHRSASRFLANAHGKEISIDEFRDGFFPYAGAAIKERFEEIKREFEPDVVFTHYRNDLHQDHRLVGELTWNTFRNHLILEYEIMKYDGDMGAPNFFVPLDDRICREKITNLLECFATQRSKNWFTEDSFRALLRVRGVECNATGGLAEAFYARKIVV